MLGKERKVSVPMSPTQRENWFILEAREMSLPRGDCFSIDSD